MTSFGTEHADRATAREPGGDGASAAGVRGRARSQRSQFWPLDPVTINRFSTAITPGTPVAARSRSARAVAWGTDPVSTTSPSCTVDFWLRQVPGAIRMAELETDLIAEHRVGRQPDARRDLTQLGPQYRTRHRGDQQTHDHAEEEQGEAPVTNQASGAVTDLRRHAGCLERDPEREDDRAHQQHPRNLVLCRDRASGRSRATTQRTGPRRTRARRSRRGRRPTRRGRRASPGCPARTGSPTRSRPWRNRRASSTPHL